MKLAVSRIDEDIAGSIVGVARQEAGLPVEHPHHHVAFAGLDEPLARPAVQIGKPDIGQIGVQVRRENLGDLVVEALAGLVGEGEVVRIGANLQLPVAGRRGSRERHGEKSDSERSFRPDRMSMPTRRPRRSVRDARPPQGRPRTRWSFDGEHVDGAAERDLGLGPPGLVEEALETAAVHAPAGGDGDVLLAVELEADSGAR